MDFRTQGCIVGILLVRDIVGMAQLHRTARARPLRFVAGAVQSGPDVQVHDRNAALSSFPAGYLAAAAGVFEEVDRGKNSVHYPLVRSRCNHPCRTAESARDSDAYYRSTAAASGERVDHGRDLHRRYALA